MQTEVDKRRHPRIEIDLPAVLVHNSNRDQASAVVGNVAPGGMFVKSDSAPPTGTAIAFCFRMLADRVCEARGRIVWTSEHGFGVAFEQTNPAMELFTEQLMKLPPHLRTFYLADVLSPQLEITH